MGHIDFFPPRLKIQGYHSDRFNMQANMQTGYVSEAAPSIFLILSYTDNGPAVMARVCKADTVRGACAELAETFSGEFRVADLDQAAWSRVVMRAKGAAEVLR